MHPSRPVVKLTYGQFRVRNLANKKARTAELKTQIKELEVAVKANPDLVLKKPQVVEYRNWIKTTKSVVDSISGENKAPTDSAAVILFELIKRSGLPTISRVVDAMNLISVRHGVAVSIWDADKVQGEISYKMSKGGEKYWPFMEDKEMDLLADELIGVDEAGICRCLVRYRDSKYAAVTLDTKNIIVHIQGINAGSDAEIVQPLKELSDLLAKCVGGDISEFSLKTVEFA